MKNFSLKLCLRGLASILIIIVFTGCDNFLDPNPKTTETSTNFFQTEDQFLLSVNAVYAQLQNWVLQAHMLEEARSDNTHFDNELNRGVLRDLVRIDWFVMIGEEPQLQNAWNTLYRGIKDVNVPLSRLENGIENGILKPDLGQRIEGELKFLRAFFHFTAVRFWGDVPLILEPFDSGLSTFEIVRNPKEEVYEVIIQDLTVAESVLPETYSGSDLGRITSGAAKALLAKVYLRRGNYNEAEGKLRDIVNSNLYSLLSDYADIFSPQNKFNSEIIHEVSFKEGDEGQSSNFLYQFAPVGSFPEVIPVLVGDGTWGRNLPTWQLVNAYEDGDVRKEASIGFFDPEGANVPYITKWAEATDESFPRTNHNWPLIRYADVLLLLAEAINEQGFNPGEPFELLNQVRNRAGLPDVSSADYPNQEAFRQALLNERRFELAFENQRWHDLVRSGTAIEVMTEHGELARENPSTPFTQTTPLNPNAWNVQDYMLMYPIPQDEMIINPNIAQNPGY